MPKFSLVGLLALAMLGFALPASVKAGFVFTIGNGATTTTAAAGANVLIPVYGHFTTALEASTFRVAGFQVAMDFGPTGNGVGSGFPALGAITNSTTGAVTSYASFSNVDGTGLNNWDKRFIGTVAIVPTFASAISLSTTPSKLFDIKFTVPTNAPAGIYAINGVATTAPTGGTLVTQINSGGSITTLNSAATIAFVNTTMTITGVPEPSSMAIVGLAGFGFVAREYRRRKLKKQA